MIGVESSEPNTPPLEMVKVPPCISSMVSVPSLARLPKSAIVFSISAKLSAWASRMTGTTRPLRRRDRDRDVEIVVIDDLLALDRGVDRGDVARGERRRLHEEAHEAEADAVLLLEQILVAGARLHHRRHVDVVEGGEHRGGVLRLLEAAGDGLAQARHPHPFLAALAGAGAGQAPARGGAAAAPAAGGGGPAPAFCALAAARTSSLVRRPSLPVPLIFDGSR